MSIVLNNGSTVVAKRRERPKLLFDESGKPTHLYNGVLFQGRNSTGGKSMISTPRRCPSTRSYDVRGTVPIHKK